MKTNAFFAWCGITLIGLTLVVVLSCSRSKQSKEATQSGQSNEATPFSSHVNPNPNDSTFTSESPIVKPRENTTVKSTENAVSKSENDALEADAPDNAANELESLMRDRFDLPLDMCKEIYRQMVLAERRHGEGTTMTKRVQEYICRPYGVSRNVGLEICIVLKEAKIPFPPATQEDEDEWITILDEGVEARINLGRG